MFFRAHIIPPRLSWVIAQIRQRLRRLDIFDFIVLIGVSCVFPINLFSFLYVSDFLLFFFAFVIVPYGVKQHKSFYFGKEQLLVVLFAAWGYCAYLLNPLHEGFFIGWSMYVMPGLLFVSVTQVMYLKTKDRGMEKGWIVWGLLIALQLMLSLDFYSNMNVDLHFKANIYWARSNYIAAMLEIPIIWCYHLMQQRDLHKRAVIFAFAFCVTALLLTVSRGGILTILLSFLLYSLLRKKFISLFFAAAVAAVLYPYFSARFNDMLDASNLDRIYLWLQAVDMVIKSPVIGYGPGDIPLYSTIFSISDMMSDPHNFILTILLHTGLIGFSLFGLLMVIFIRRALRMYKRRKNPFFLVVLFSAFFHGMVEPTFLGYSYSFMFWCCMAMLMVQSRKLDPDPAPSAQPLRAAPT